MKWNRALFVVTIVSLLSCGVPSWAQSVAEEFSYSGDTGPGHWAEIDEGCASTATSKQSPIDLDSVVPDPRLEPLRPIGIATTVSLVNNGHTLMATPINPATVAIQGVTYTLMQFHFHTLAEHTVDGRQGTMELHAVFQNAQLNYAVIGVVYRIGKPNQFLQRLLKAGLPQKTTSPSVTVDKVNIEDGFTDTSSYYNYEGSLSTPPCSENVKWFVLKQWAEMSQEQLDAFRNVLGNDFRPLQKRNGRIIRATVGLGPF